MDTSKDRNVLKIHYNKRQKSIHGELKSVQFQENGSYIIYIPSINVSAYGDTPSEAEYMLQNVVLKDFCKTLLDLTPDELLKELGELGWERSPFFKLELSNSAHIDKEGILKNFDLSEDTKMEEKLVTV